MKPKAFYLLYKKTGGGDRSVEQCLSHNWKMGSSNNNGQDVHLNSLSNKQISGFGLPLIAVSKPN